MYSCIRRILKNPVAALNWTQHWIFQVNLAAQFLPRCSMELSCMIRERSLAVSDVVTVFLYAGVAAISVKNLTVFRQAVIAMSCPKTAAFSVSAINIWQFIKVVKFFANMIKNRDIFFWNTNVTHSIVKLVWNLSFQ